MKTVLHQLESFLLRGPVEAAKTLGVSYSSYAAMKAGSREIPLYVRYHAETIQALDADRLHRLLKDRLK
jgi:hypothetical protein